MARRKTTSKSKLRPGGGGRFERLVQELMRKGYSRERAERIAAVIGRRKYGKRRFQKMAAAGRKRAAKK